MTAAYAYDTNGNRQSLTYGNGTTESYAYDLRGNRTQLTVGGTESYTTLYTYDLNNRLLTETKNAGTEAELREYHYDANGNTLSVSVGTPSENGQGFAATLTGGGAVAYTYDAFNRMTSVENEEGIHTYAYRPDGLRQSKTVGGVTTTHIWDGQNIAAEQENGAVTAVYIRGVNLLARQDNTGARQYYLYNAHGDVTQLTDEAGSVSGHTITTPSETSGRLRVIPARTGIPSAIAGSIGITKPGRIT